jgi:hypothetical protein
MVFTVITNYKPNNKNTYKLGYYRYNGQWVQLQAFDGREEAFAEARRLNGVGQ